MKYILFCVLLISTVLTGYSQGVMVLQDKPFVYAPPVDTALQRELNANVNFRNLSKTEQQMYYWVNMFRKDPNRFYEQAVREFIRQFPEANTAEVKSLKRDLKNIKSLPLLFPDMGLTKMSKEHGADLAKRGGIISHKSASGKDFTARIKEAGQYRCGAENIFSGSPDFLQALIALLIDQGVPDKGHRINLLEPRFERMGVSITSVSSKKAVFVQEFACK
jgi:hypothetical protein